jgi:predicted transcriptional regulator
MFEAILSSKLMSSAIAFLLANQPRSFSVLELGKICKVSKAKAQKIVLELVGSGILTQFSKKGKKYYMLNPKFRYFNELRAKLNKQIVRNKDKDKISRQIRNLGEVRAAFLSGIFTGYPTLPVDLLLVGKVNLKKLDRFLSEQESWFGQEINYSVMTPDEFVLRRDTFDRFIRDIFDYRYITLVEKLGKRK